MRFVLHLLGMIAVALAIGFGLSWYALTDGRFLGAVELGPWTTWPNVGSPTADPYTRAYLARTGALQLGLSEGLAFTAARDSDGRPLDRGCRYRVEGSTPTAAFWTLAAVAPNGINIAAPNGPLALRSTGLAREQDGSFILHVGQALSPGNWLEISGGDGPFELVLTLYDTSIFSAVASGVTTLPPISREACP